MQKSAAALKMRTLAPEIRELSEVYFTSLDCPRSLTVLILMRYGEFDQIASIKATPADYLLASQYHLAALASDWLRKYPGLPVKVDPEIEAKKSWFQSEKECGLQNQRAPALRADVKLLLDVASEFVATVLGACPLDLTPAFGPGATASDPAKRTTVLDKVTSRPTVTSEATAVLPLWVGTAWERSHLDSDNYKKDSYNSLIVEGNTFFTVPKTALTHRGCAKGPSINVAYQLAVGQCMRKRLLSFGLDLAKGQDRHQALAKAGSKDGTLVTLDSERASDTMSTSTVRSLLSKAGFWPDLLETLREPKTYIDGQWVCLEKFSAMGCGYTFELETLVFLSICYAVAWSYHIGGDFPQPFHGETPWSLVRNGSITVYGDDVIVPTFMGRDVAAVLGELGFTINLKKSYFEGQFRESCGGDYFNGIAVETAKLEKEPSEPADWFSIHNLVKSRFVDCYPCLDGKNVLNVIKNQLPRQYRSMYGPTYLGDRVLHGWYGPQVRTSARLVKNADGSVTPDPNQWVASLKALAPRLEQARLLRYEPLAQLAYILYTGGTAAPMRRPTSTLRYDVVDFESDYYVCFEDYVPRAPEWLSKSPFARFFGILPNGAYVD